MEPTVLVLFAAWSLLALLLRLSNSLFRFVEGYDLLYLFPSYRFFAPRPELRFPRLAMREVNEAGVPVGEWVDAGVWGPRSWTAAVWHPERRAGWALMLACLAVHDQHPTPFSRPSCPVSDDYRRVVNAVTAHRLLRGRTGPFALRLIVCTRRVDGGIAWVPSVESGPHPTCI